MDVNVVGWSALVALVESLDAAVSRLGSLVELVSACLAVLCVVAGLQLWVIVRAAMRSGDGR